MDHWKDDPVRAEIDPVSDLVALWTASNPEELWQALVVQPGRSTTDHWSAVGLLRQPSQRLRLGETLAEPDRHQLAIGVPASGALDPVGDHST